MGTTEANLKHKFGLSSEDYELMLQEQDGKCAICNSFPEEGRKLVVDHNHATGQIRGLLCKGCNFALGLVGEQISTLEYMYLYIQKHS